jgi:arginine decarboxylase
MNFVPKEMFFTKGAGKHKEKLESFEAALRDAGIQSFNIVNVSSILPPYCKITTKEKGLPKLKPGQILFCVMARNDTNEPNRLIAASIGCAVARDRDHYGYLSEHHSFGEKEQTAGDYAEDLAATMLASTLGVPFDPEKDYNVRKEVYKMCDEIVVTRNVTQTAEGDKNGLWTTVVAAAVFIMDPNGP